jgi:glutathione S-transferase
VLQFIADQHHAAGLAPLGGLGRARLQQWLCFIGTELHKALFVVLLDPKQGDAAKARAQEIGASRLACLNKHLTGRDYLLDGFSVADAYLVTVLNWARATPVDLKPYPAVQAYYERLQTRPSVAKAMGEEFELYRAEQGRRAAA